MSASPASSVLESQDWDDVTDQSTPWTLEKSWKRYWRPTGHGRLRNLARAIFRRASFSESKNLRPTAYLDGLRGFAAFLVYWHHHELWAHGMAGQNGVFENAFGYEDHYEFVTFPVVRHFFSGGHYAVSTFFIISGYVLSMKPLDLIQSDNTHKLVENLSSALFRRWFRLFLPLIALLLIYITSWHVFGIWINGVTQQSTWWDEIKAFYLEFKNFSFVYKGDGIPWLSHHFHLWSIPVEFKGSMVIYASLMALSRSTRNARLLCEVGLIYYFMYITDGWYCAMFIAGMLLCDLDHLARKGDLPGFLLRLAPAKTFIFYHLFALSLFLGGVPSQNADVEQLGKNRGWYYLSFLKPQAVFDYKWFFLFWAATFLVASIRHISWLKRFFETGFCQYLGRISFALYMVHGPVLWTLGDRLYLATGWQTDDHLQHIPQWAGKFPLSRSGPFGLELSFLVPNIILLPLTLFLAELVTRFIDTPSVRFTSWLYKITRAEDQSQQSLKHALA